MIETEIVDDTEKKELYYPSLKDGTCFVFEANPDIVYVKGLDFEYSAVRTNLKTGLVFNGSLTTAIIQVYPKNQLEFTLAKPEGM